VAQVIKWLVAVITVAAMSGCTALCSVVFPEQTEEDRKTETTRYCAAVSVKW
jgi:predicted small lipoprotein YifL